jgi:hypothetical protein
MKTGFSGGFLALTPLYPNQALFSFPACVKFGMDSNI